MMGIFLCKLRGRKLLETLNYLAQSEYDQEVEVISVYSILQKAYYVLGFYNHRHKIYKTLAG